MVGKSSKKAIKLAKGITSRTGYATGGSPFYGQDAYNQLMGDITNQRKAAIPPVGQFDLYKGAKGTAPAAPKGTAPGGEDTKIIPPTDGSSGNYDGGGSGGSEQTETPPDGPPGSFNNPFSGMLDNAINNPGTTAINAGVGLFGGPFGIANSISAAFGGPNVGGLVTGSYGQNKAGPVDIHDPNAVIDLNTPTPATIGSATSYDKGSAPRDQGTMTAPKGGPIESYDLAPPAPTDLGTKSVQTTSVAPTDQFAGMYNGTPPAAKADVETDRGVSIANTQKGAAQLEAEMEAQQAQQNQAAIGAQVGAQVGSMLGASAPKADVETDRGVSIANTAKGVSQLEGRDMQPGVQAPTFSAPPAFATAEQLQNPDQSYTMGVPHAESVSAYSYGTLNDQNQTAQNTLGDISRGLDSFDASQNSVSVADPSSLSQGMQDALSAAESEAANGNSPGGFGGGFGDGSISGESYGGGWGDGSTSGSTGDNSSGGGWGGWGGSGADDSGGYGGGYGGDGDGDGGGGGGDSGGNGGGGGDGGGGDGGGGGGDGGGEKRGGFIRLKKHVRPNEAAIKKALKIASKHTKSKNKTIAKKPSVVK